MSRNKSRQTQNQQWSPSVQQGGTDADGRRDSRASQAYSPEGQISRTPTADRQLLRTLTVTPENDEPTYHPPPAPPVEQNKNSYGRQTAQSTANRDTGQSAFDEPSYHSSPAPVTGNQSQYGRQTAETAGRDSLGRQTAQTTATKSPTATYQGTTNKTALTPVTESANRGGDTRASTVASRTVIEIPTSKPETSRKPETNRADDWQSSKSVAESNNYMLKYEVACDVTFAVGDSKDEIRAHKYMLMARSPVLFRSLVRHLGNTDVKIGVPDIKPEVFREMLQYIYTDEFDIHTDNVSPVLFAAKKFQLKGLSDLCFQYLAAEMSDATVAKVMEQAHIYNESNLFDKCLRFVFANGNDVLRNPSFGQLCAECLEKVLRSDELRASEEAVFEGSIIWANAECRRQKLQPTDQDRRDVLGKMLYLIRFPLMGVTYFTQKVSLGELLSHDEKLSIFQYYHGEKQQLPQRFSRTERKQIPKDPFFNNNIPQETYTMNDHGKHSPIVSTSKVKRVKRFRGSDGQWKQNGPPDAISFTTSQPIVLYGVEIFGSCKGTETYPVKLFVYDDISRQEIRKNEESIYTSSKKDTYDVFLTRPLRVPAKRVFTVVVALKGCPTYKGVDGEAIHTADGVTFEFSDSNRSSNGSDVTVGQIAGMLFNRTQ